MPRIAALGLLLLAAPVGATEPGSVGRALLAWRSTPMEPTVSLLRRTLYEETQRAGVYVGPLYVEGPLARVLDKLPAPLRRSMQAKIGPTAIVPTDGWGAGIGIYARLDR